MDSKVVEGVNPPTNFQYFLSLREHPQHTRTTRDQLSGTVLKIVVLQRNRTSERTAPSPRLASYLSSGPERS